MLGPRQEGVANLRFAGILLRVLELLLQLDDRLVVGCRTEDTKVLAACRSARARRAASFCRRGRTLLQLGQGALVNIDARLGAHQLVVRHHRC